MQMKRRRFLATAAALAAPKIAAAQSARVLRFVPQTDVAVLDPIWTTAYVTRNHGYLVFDTLYGLDDQFVPQPQMVEGHSIEDNGKLWRLTLREGLKFHDGEPVRARDAVASILRWGKRDTFGQTLLAVTDELSAPSDSIIQFRLKRPFPLLPAALGKAQTAMPCIMPERLAKTDAFTQVSEIIGSGPYRFLPAERVSGAHLAYQRFEGYVPRPSGTQIFTSGPKIAHFDRVEWTIIPDPATAAAALRAGEIDWLEQPTIDLQPMLRRDSSLVVRILDPLGLIGNWRPNHLYPPFDNPAIRRAVLGAINQAECMTAIVGDDPSLWHDKVGVFTPGTPFATDVGMQALTSPRDYKRVQADLAAAGYQGEKVVFLAAADYPALSAICQVVADQLRRAGLNIDYQSMDWGTVQQRRPNKSPPAQGGWNCFVAFGGGLDYSNPVGNTPLRTTGQEAWLGWPTSEKLEALRSAWIDAATFADQQRICRDIQQQFFQDVPYIPLGQFFQATAYRNNLTGILSGFPLFTNVQRT